MKAKMAGLAGIGAPLILTGSAPAGFVGVTTVHKVVLPHYAPDLYVCNVYAVFDRPDDEMVAVAGTPDHPLNIFVKDGTFYQNAQGAPLTAPFIQFVGHPLLPCDTFVTIGTKTNDLFSTLDDVTTTPGLAFVSDHISTSNGSWFILPSGPGQGGLGAPDANGHVLIGQFTVVLDGIVEGIAGTMLLQFTSNGVSGQQAYVEFNHPIPAPGALALLGLGASAGACRARRARL